MESREDPPPLSAQSLLPGALAIAAALGLLRPLAAGSALGFPVIKLLYTFFPPLTAFASSSSSSFFLVSSVVRSPPFRILAPRFTTASSFSSTSSSSALLLVVGRRKGEPTDFRERTESESDDGWRDSIEAAAAAALRLLTMELAPSWIAFQSKDSESGEAGLLGASEGSSSARMLSSALGTGSDVAAAAAGAEMAAAFFFFLGIAELMHSCSRSSSESMLRELSDEFLEKQTGVSSTWNAFGA